MTYTRNPLVAGLPVTDAQISDHLRIIGPDEITRAEPIVEAATAELEAYCGLALLVQTITATTARWPGQTIALPVGPLVDGGPVTVAQRETDGSLTPVLSGWWIEGGRYPRLHFPDTIPTGPLVITYRAGFGTGPGDVPADLRLAVCDQALRLYDMRGAENGPATLSPAAARIAARWRRVSLGGTA